MYHLNIIRKALMFSGNDYDIIVEQLCEILLACFKIIELQKVQCFGVGIIKSMFYLKGE